jgi:putative membrane protein
MENATLRIKFWDRIAWVLTAVVLVLVGLMRRPEKLNLGIDFSFLPPVYSTLNALVAVALVLALLKIKKRDIAGHKFWINVSMLGSAVFLLCYVLYHFTTAETKFGGQGAIRSVYFFLLITHIVLSGATLPFILMAYVRGYFDALMAHRKLVKWIWPLWFYVACTGPICYLMLRPYFAK